MALQLRDGAPTHLKNFNPEGLLSKGNTGTKSGAETEGKTWGSIPHADTKPRHYYGCQEVLADSSMIWMYPERLGQRLTSTAVNACSQL